MRMNIDNACKLIKDFAYTQIQITKQANSGMGVTKKACKEEKQAIKALLFELIGETPTDQQIEMATPQ